MAFDDVTGGGLGSVMRPPRFGEDFVYHNALRVDPNDTQVKKDKEHVDSTIEAIIFRIDQNQGIGESQVAAKGEAP